jgi:uncharacterized protein (DUF1330 family)
MAAYVIVDIDVTDPVRYEDYKRVSGATLTPFGGRFLVRGGPVQRLEGERTPGRVVVLEFPDPESARRWWESEIYAGPKLIRQATARTEMILVQGA